MGISGSTPGAWYFVTLPPEPARELFVFAPALTKPGGTLRVTVMLGHSSWQTSLFRDTARQSYLLPVKASVRAKEHLAEGAEVEVTIIVAGE